MELNKIIKSLKPGQYVRVSTSGLISKFYLQGDYVVEETFYHGMPTIINHDKDYEFTANVYLEERGIL